MSTGNIGYGAVLAYSADDVTYTSVAQVLDIDGPSIKTDSVDITNMDSTSATREKIPGLIDPGQYTFSIVHLKTTVTALFALLRVVRFWRLTLPGGEGVWKSKGFIVDLKPGTPVEDKMTDDLTIELSEVLTFT